MFFHLGYRLSAPPSPAVWGAMSGGAGICNGSRKVHMSETLRIERLWGFRRGDGLRQRKNLMALSPYFVIALIADKAGSHPVPLLIPQG